MTSAVSSFFAICKMGTGLAASSHLPRFCEASLRPAQDASQVWLTQDTQTMLWNLFLVIFLSAFLSPPFSESVLS